MVKTLQKFDNFKTRSVNIQVSKIYVPLAFRGRYKVREIALNYPKTYNKLKVQPIRISIFRDLKLQTIFKFQRIFHLIFEIDFLKLIFCLLIV